MKPNIKKPLNKIFASNKKFSSKKVSNLIKENRNQSTNLPPFSKTSKSKNLKNKTLEKIVTNSIKSMRKTSKKGKNSIGLLILDNSKGERLNRSICNSPTNNKNVFKKIKCNSLNNCDEFLYETNKIITPRTYDEFFYTKKNHYKINLPQKRYNKHKCHRR